MSVLQTLYRGENHFDFVGNRRRWLLISGMLLLVTVLSLGLRGLNLGVDFEGGTLVEIENPNGASVGEVRDAIADLGLAGARVQTTGGGGTIRVQTEELSPDDEQALVDVLAEVAGEDPSEASRLTVGPTFGREIRDRALVALAWFLVVVVIYMSFRLEWKMAVAGLIALIHDLLITTGIYSLSGLEVTPATVIAILTILGYSLYDTVVVFDKVVENVSERGDKHTASAIVNMSMNQVFMRSINTSLTSLLPIGSLLFVGSFLLGAATLREFALALFIGVGLGTYSSIFVAAPILAVWKEREETWQRVRRRLERKGVEDDAFEVRGFVADAEETPVTIVEAGSTGATPRPPRKRKKSR
ncbi:MAG TPA: protein translocase subunit SecF [Acidimicrobiia bacterium]|nr:protein translocase subunit SecF [Acidimicrobiia bacterium]